MAISDSLHHHEDTAASGSLDMSSAVHDILTPPDKRSRSHLAIVPHHSPVRPARCTLQLRYRRKVERRRIVGRRCWGVRWMTVVRVEMGGWVRGRCNFIVATQGRTDTINGGKENTQRHGAAWVDGTVASDGAGRAPLETRGWQLPPKSGHSPGFDSTDGEGTKGSYSAQQDAGWNISRHDGIM